MILFGYLFLFISGMTYRTYRKYGYLLDLMAAIVFLIVGVVLVILNLK